MSTTCGPRARPRRSLLSGAIAAWLALGVVTPARARDAGVVDPAGASDAGVVETEAASSDPLASLRRQKETLAALARPEAAPPDDTTLRRIFGFSDLRRMTLRERANALRLRARAARDLDAGVSVDGGAADVDSGALEPSSTIALTPEDERLVADALVVLRRAIVRVGENEDRAHALAVRTQEEVARAEAARSAALEEAQRARTARVEALLARAARIAGLEADIARAQGELQGDATSTGDVLAAALSRAQALRERARSVDEGDRRTLLIETVREERTLLDALDAWRARAHDRLAAIDAMADPVLARASERTAPVGDDEREGQGRVDAAAKSARAARDALADASERQTKAILEAGLAAVEPLDEVRTALTSGAGAALSSELYGLTELGVDNVTTSLRHVRAKVRVHVAARATVWRDPAGAVGSVLAVGRAILSIGLGLWWLVVAFVVWRRAPRVWPRVRTALTRSLRSRESSRVASLALDVAEIASGRVFLALVVVQAARAMGEALPEPETSFVVEIVLFVLAYQLAARLSHFAILRFTRAHVQLTPETRLAVLRSVQLVLRTGFISFVALGFLYDLVGDDVLYTAAQAATAVATLPVAVVLLLRWRERIVTSYVATHPDNWLTRAFAERERGAARTGLAAIAVIFVVGKALVVFGRDFALGFEQTRKALAFLFRLRIERQAKARGRVAFDASALPPRLVTVCGEGPVTSTSGLIASRVESAHEEAGGFFEARRGRSLLVDAARGMGLSTWLFHLARAADEGGVRVCTFAPTSRLTSARALNDALTRALPKGEGAADSASVVERTLASEVDVVVVDGLDWLFLRSLGGYDGLDALLDVVRGTRHRVSWVLAGSDVATEFLVEARDLDAHVTHRRTLPPWSEEEIRRLLLDRRRRSGLTISYDELLVHGLDIASSEVVETEEGYTRLLWNFAGGNPRIAQHFWLRSLVVKNEREVTVRLYDAPSPDDLEGLPEDERYMLAATHLHGALTPDELARACRAQTPHVSAHVNRGLDLGFYVKNDDDGVRVPTLWSLAVQKYLRRKNLL